MSVATLLELLRSGAEELASQPVAEAEFHAALTELVAGTLRAVRKPEEKELRVPWMREGEKMETLGEEGGRSWKTLGVWIISCFVWFDGLKLWTSFSEMIWFVFSRRAFLGFILSCMSQLGDERFSLVS